MDSWSGDGFSLGWGEREIQLERKSEKSFQLWIIFFYEKSTTKQPWICDFDISEIYSISALFCYRFYLCYAGTSTFEYFSRFDLYHFSYTYIVYLLISMGEWDIFVIPILTWIFWRSCLLLFDVYGLDLNNFQLTDMNSLEMFGS